MHPTTTDSKIMFLGLDSAEPALLEQWCDDGTLPNLARLRSRAVKSPVVIPEGFANGATWPSIFTGFNPGEHGRYYSRQLEPGTYEIRRFDTDRDYMVEPFWVELGDKGVRAGIVDMVRAPLTPGFNGFQIADWLSHDPRWDPTRSYPESLAAEVNEKCGKVDSKGRSEDLFPTVDDRLDEYIEYLTDRIRRKTELILHLARRPDWRLLMSVYGEPHEAGHRLWHLHDPAHPQFVSGLSSIQSDPLRSVYEAIDDAIGRLIKAHPQLTIMLLAGPGIEPSYTGNKAMPQVLRAFALPGSVGLSTREKGGQVFRTAARRMLPSSLRVRIRRWASRMSKISSPLFRGSTFALPNASNAAAVRLNLVGREPRGKVNPADYDRLCAELTRRFLDLKNGETGEPVVSRVIKIREVCNGRALNRLPDLLVLWNRTAPIPSIEVPGLGRVDVPLSSRTGDHSTSCMMLTAGPSFRKGRTAPVRAEDIAPTIAAMFGLCLERTDGTVIQDLVPTPTGVAGPAS